MSSLRTRGRLLLKGILTDPAVVWYLTIAYIAFGLLFVRTAYTLNDEGLLTHYWADWARHDFLPVFFLQKVKPVLSAFYLPFSAGGISATLTAHVVVSSLAIPLIASTARALGQRLPNLPAIVLLLSPIYFFGGGAGLPNLDGVVGITLVLYLLGVRSWPFLAGVVLGFLPWVRYELCLFGLSIALYALTSKGNRSLLFGIAIFPVLYSAAGALYHHDPLWLAHFPPAAPQDPGNPIYALQLIGFRYFFEPALALTPAAGFVAALRFGRLTRLERLILAYAVLAVAAVHILPILKIGNFGASPRYSLHVLPALALLLGRAVEPWWEGERPRPSGLMAVLLLAAWLATRQVDQKIVLPLLVVYAIIVTTAWFGAGGLAVAQMIALLVVGPLLPVRSDMGRTTIAPYLDPMVRWIESHRSEIVAPIYTNSQLLAPYLEMRGRAPGAKVFFVAGVDMIYELKFLMNQRNGQYERVERLAKADFYGEAIVDRLTPDDLPAGALLVLRVDSRLPLLFPGKIWAPRLEVLMESTEYQIARLRQVQPSTDGGIEDGSGERRNRDAQ